MNEQPVVEPRGPEIANMCLEDERLEAEVAQALVAAGVALEVLDACDLEPHEVVRVVGDALCVRLGEAHLDRSLKAEAVHEAWMLADRRGRRS
jgi:hypothetical protein